MAPNQHLPTCADCGQPIRGTPVVLSRTEAFCEACWPFLLKPIPAEDLPVNLAQEPGRDEGNTIPHPSQKIA